MNMIYRVYSAVLMFLGILGRNGEGNWFYRSPDGCNGKRFMPRETWKLAWGFWKTWDDCNGKYRRVWR
jgi:hypothetical protein